MTDLERFKDFYSQIGIELKPAQVEDSDNIILRIGAEDYGGNDVNHSDKFDGYFGFYSDAEFSPEGKFIRQGFWE